MWSEALPIVVYSSCTEAVVTVPDWPQLYASLQALKGHAQEYPGCQRFDVYFKAGSNDELLLHLYTSWDTVEQLEAFLERGYTFERLIGDFGGKVEVEKSLVMEKIF
ncbi:MAG TPA: hypothetical protein VH817_00735 [Thermoleophilaceae bacterium]|jgi:hypothetical protein